MIDNAATNYTDKPQLSARLKVLRKIIAFVFAINMLITRLFGGAGVSVNTPVQQYSPV